MKRLVLTVSRIVDTYPNFIDRDVSSYIIENFIVEPYDEGTTGKEDHPCVTISFKEEYWARKFNIEQMPLNGIEDNCKDEGYWFCHFWQIPEGTTVSVAYQDINIEQSTPATPPTNTKTQFSLAWRAKYH